MDASTLIYRELREIAREIARLNQEVSLLRETLIGLASDRKTEPQTTDYCDACNHKGCDNCIADGSNPYCVPSHYEPKDEPQTEDACEGCVNETDCPWR